MLYQPDFMKVSLGVDSSSFEGSWLSPTVCLNHTVMYKYLFNTDLYLTFSKYVDKLLAVKSLINILKFTLFKIVFYSFFSQISVV